MCTADIFLALIALLFPPLAVWVKRGLCSADSLINLALCCLGFLPGVIHAWYIIYATPDFYEYERVVDVEGRPVGSGNVQYFYVSPSRPQNYGTVGNPYTQPNPRPQPSTQPQSQPLQPQQQPTEGSSNAEVPPTYNEAIKGDNKVQKP